MYRNRNGRMYNILQTTIASPVMFITLIRHSWVLCGVNCISVWGFSSTRTCTRHDTWTGKLADFFSPVLEKSLPPGRARKATETGGSGFKNKNRSLASAQRDWATDGRKYFFAIKPRQQNVLIAGGPWPERAESLESGSLVPCYNGVHLLQPYQRSFVKTDNRPAWNSFWVHYHALLETGVFLWPSCCVDRIVRGLAQVSTGYHATDTTKSIAKGSNPIRGIGRAGSARSR